VKPTVSDVTALQVEMGIDAQEIALRKAFLEFTPQDVGLLRSIHGQLNQLGYSFPAAFYDHLLSFGPLQNLLPDSTTLERLKQSQSTYFSALTAGDYEEAYVQDRLQVGMVHQRVGLEPKWYIGAYRKYLTELLPIIWRLCANNAEDFLAVYSALLKIIMFDMGLAIDTYFHADRRSLVELKAFSDQLLACMPSGLLALSEDLNILFANTALVDMLGLGRKATLRGTPLRDILPSAQLSNLALQTIASDEHFHGAIIDMADLYGGMYLEVDISITRHEGKRVALLMLQDITQRIESERAVKDSEERFSATFNQAAVGLAHVAPDGRWLRVNRKLCDIVGYTEEELLKLTFQDITHPDDLDRDLDKVRQMLAGTISVYAIEKRYFRKTGGYIWINLTLSLMRDEHGEPKYFISVVEDITQRKRFERAFHAIIAGTATASGDDFFRTLVMNLANAVGARYAFVGRLMDHRHDRIQVIASWTGTDFGDNFQYDLAGTPCEDVVGKTLCHFPHSIQFQFPEDKLLVEMQAESYLGIPLFSNSGETLGILVVLHDQPMDDIASAINVMGVFGARAGAELERLLFERQLTHLANHDALTSLPNRNLLQDRLHQAIAHTQRTGQLLAVLFLDLDRFKTINDSLGHDKGDRVLTIISTRLAGCVRDGDTIARLGGDEFIILLQDLSREEDAAIVAGKIISCLQQPLAVNGHELFITASIGISFYPQDGDDGNTLLKNADTAMYRAKESGRNAFALYNQAMNAQALRHLQMETALRHALERDELSLHYQPQVNLRSGLITGVEALLRWRNPEYGLVSPAEFIPLAEDTDLILEIGNWVLKTACRQAKQWNDTYNGELRIAVNLSARQFRQSDLPGQISNALQASGLDPELLELEITEGTVMHNAEESVATLRRLRDMGVKLSIDDFGTGYSSLSYLKRFPINIVKIDQSFVRDITTDPDDAAIACSIIALAHSMKLQVIAEGVETEGQLGFLQANQCDQMQGYYFSRPLPKEELGQLLSDGKRLQEVLMEYDGKRTLLIIDNQCHLGKTLTRVLRPDEYRILLAENVTQAFELLATQHVGVVICDQRMPQMSGTEFLIRVKELHPNTVRMVLSDYTDMKTTTEAVDLGTAYKFLTKPWNDEVLRGVIRDAFQHYEMEYENVRLRAQLKTLLWTTSDFNI
jgi:diguanylate cyclase (GGDEF)-like protein/PAS domain S-box-containing protein